MSDIDLDFGDITIKQLRQRWLKAFGNRKAMPFAQLPADCSSYGMSLPTGGLGQVVDGGPLSALQQTNDLAELAACQSTGLRGGGWRFLRVCHGSGLLCDKAPACQAPSPRKAPGQPAGLAQSAQGNGCFLCGRSPVSVLENLHLLH